MENKTNLKSKAVFDNQTKKVCACSFISLILIILFIISPLNSFLMTSFIVKLFILTILAYAIYIHIKQTNELNNAKKAIVEAHINYQMKINLICSYIFAFFLGLLFIFVLKSLF